jgi:hypothetical protein
LEDPHSGQVFGDCIDLYRNQHTKENSSMFRVSTASKSQQGINVVTPTDSWLDCESPTTTGSPSPALPTDINAHPKTPPGAAASEEQTSLSDSLLPRDPGTCCLLTQLNSPFQCNCNQIAHEQEMKIDHDQVCGKVCSFFSRTFFDGTSTPAINSSHSQSERPNVKIVPFKTDAESHVPTLNVYGVSNPLAPGLGKWIWKELSGLTYIHGDGG